MTQDQRTVLITGGTRGIGASIAQAYAEQGAAIIATGTDSEQIATLKTSELRNFTYRAVDFCNRKSTDDFLHFVRDLPRIDVCINNAGINIIQEVGNINEEDFHQLMDVNYRAPFLLSQAVAPKMARCGGGHIVNIASIWSVVAKAHRTLYCGAKSGLVGMTRAMAVEFAPQRVLLNCVSPGFVLTDLTRNSLSPEQRQELLSDVPMGRFAEPVEIAKTVLFLASEENTYITGQNIVIDGGFTCV